MTFLRFLEGQATPEKRKTTKCEGTGTGWSRTTAGAWSDDAVVLSRTIRRARRSRLTPTSIVPDQVFLSSGFGFRMESSLSKGLEVKGGGFSLYACDAPCTAPCDDGRSIAGD